MLVGEIYTYFATRIYMTLHIENKISDYLNTSDITLFHPISKYIPRNRFQELYLRFRYVELGIKGPYARVNSTTKYNYF
jgi:hypothetical protein